MSPHLTATAALVFAMTLFILLSSILLVLSPLTQAHFAQLPMLCCYVAASKFARNPKGIVLSSNFNTCAEACGGQEPNRLNGNSCDDVHTNPSFIGTN